MKKNKEDRIKIKKVGGFFLDIVFFTIVISLLTQSIFWLFHEIDLISLYNNCRNVVEGQFVACIVVNKSHPTIFNNITLPFLITSFLGLIAIKIGNQIIEWLWILVKLLAKWMWNALKKCC